jgi:transcriptional regulator with XRE-family HTH domain
MSRDHRAEKLSAPGRSGPMMPRHASPEDAIATAIGRGCRAPRGWAMSKTPWYPTPKIEQAYAEYISGLTSRVEKLMEARGLNRAELSLKMKRSDSYIHQLLKDGFSPSRGALDAMARALGVTEEFLRLGTIPAAPGAVGDVEDVDDAEYDNEEDEDMLTNDDAAPKAGALPEGARLPATTTAVPTRTAERPCGAERPSGAERAGETDYLALPFPLILLARHHRLDVDAMFELLDIWEHGTARKPGLREPTADDWERLYAIFKDFL